MNRKLLLFQVILIPPEAHRIFHLAKDFGDELFVIINNDVQRALKKSSEFMLEDERLIIVSELAITDKVILSVDKDNTVSKSLEEHISTQKIIVFILQMEMIK